MRIFIAINLPAEAKQELVSYQKRWKSLPVRWTPPENLHVTLVFIGWVTQKQVKRIVKVGQKLVQKHNPFSIKLHTICLGPPNKPPRMIWVEGERNKEVVQLKRGLEAALVKVDNTGLNKKESRTYHPHITLGRINKKQWRKLKQQPQINEKISIKVPVNSIEVMESELKRTGAEYSVVESAKLSKGGGG